MAYFPKSDDGAQRGGKLAADIATGLLLGQRSSIVYFERDWRHCRVYRPLKRHCWASTTSCRTTMTSPAVGVR